MCDERLGTALPWIHSEVKHYTVANSQIPLVILGELEGQGYYIPFCWSRPSVLSFNNSILLSTHKHTVKWSVDCGSTYLPALSAVSRTTHLLLTGHPQHIIMQPKSDHLLPLFHSTFTTTNQPTNRGVDVVASVAL
mmetsp:Transcript_30143/g.46158  ORF Transcript_30143/g.46158 Transcript_30143/m.46158 type:complete len:136 (-) Transcript_30143:440-847(-)